MSETEQFFFEARQRSVVQSRSRARMAKILETAQGLIAENGFEALKMSEIATKCGISIGSLYQYFEDKKSIISELANQYYAQTRICVEETLAQTKNIDEVFAAFLLLTDINFQNFKQNRALRDIWVASQTYADLAANELVESKFCANLIANAIHAHDNSLNVENILPQIFVLWQSGEAAIRMAITSDTNEAEQIIQAYKTIARRTFCGMLIQHLPPTE